MGSEPAPSLRPELLSGRSLRPDRRPGWRRQLRERRGVIVAALLVILVVGSLFAVRSVALSTADDVIGQRVAELESLLDDATTDDFLAFGQQVQQAGSLAEAVRDQEDFVNLRATAGLTFIRFQPSGWWAGFTERCVVALVRSDSVVVESVGTNCVRVSPPDS